MSKIGVSYQELDMFYNTPGSMDGHREWSPDESHPNKSLLKVLPWHVQTEQKFPCSRVERKEGDMSLAK